MIFVASNRLTDINGWKNAKRVWFTTLQTRLSPWPLHRCNPNCPSQRRNRHLTLNHPRPQTDHPGALLGRPSRCSPAPTSAKATNQEKVHLEVLYPFQFFGKLNHPSFFFTPTCTPTESKPCLVSSGMKVLSDQGDPQETNFPPQSFAKKVALLLQMACGMPNRSLEERPRRRKRKRSGKMPKKVLKTHKNHTGVRI